MAETLINAVTAPGLWSEVGQQLPMQALDNANGNYIVAEDNLIVIVHNTDVSSQAIRFTSQPYPGVGRTGDINQSIPAGEMWAFYMTKMGWQDPNGNILMPSGQNANLQISVLVL